jgi:hypothetical protein
VAGSNKVTVNDLALAKAIPASRHMNNNAFFIFRFAPSRVLTA